MGSTYHTFLSINMHKQFTTYLYWAFWVGVAFFTVYPSANWLTSQREGLFHLYLQEELEMPLMPEFIWVYMSMYVLFMMPPFFLNSDELPRLGKQLIVGTLIGGLMFLIFPSILGFERIVPDASPYDQLFATIFSIDHPHNLVPSLHVVFSACIILAISDRTKGWGYGILMFWLIVIMVSTLLVHQHHVIDVIAGLVLTIMLRTFYKEEP